MKLIKKEHIWILIGALFAFGLSAIWFANGLPKATGESGLLFSTIDKQFEIAKNTWADTTIGETPFSFNGAIPLFFVFKVVASFTSGAVVQWLFFAITIFIGILGVGMLTKHIEPKVNQYFLLFIAISYVFNPYSIVFVWNRFLYNYTLAYCLVPLLIALWLKYLRSGNNRQLFVFFITSFLGSFAFTGIAYLIVFGFVMAFTTVFCFISSRNKREFLTRTVSIGITFLFSQLFWLLPFYAGNRLGVGQSTSFFSEQGNLYTTIQLSEYYGGLLNKLTLIRADMPALAYEDIPWAVWYSNTWVNTVSAIAIVMVVISLIVMYLLKFSKRYVLGVSFIALLLLANGTSFPIGKIYLLLYKLSPVLGALRNPYEKAGFMLYLVMFIIWGLGIWVVYEQKSKAIGKGLLVVSAMWWIVNAVPIFNGVVFTYKYEVSNNPKIGFSVQVPDYYKEANSIVNKDTYESRLLALPITGEGVTHSWKVGYDGVESYNGLFTKSAISLDTTTGQLPQIAKYFRDAQPEQILSGLPLLNVSSIIVRSDLIPPINTANPSYIQNKLDSLIPKENRLSVGNNNLSIYSVPTTFQSPRLFISDKYLSQNVAKFDPANRPANGVTYFSSGTASDIYYPDALFSEPPSQGRALYEQNQLLPMPHVSVQKDSLLYPLIQIKEYVWRLTHGYELMPITSTLSFKRLAEIEPLITLNDTSRLQDALAEYEQTTMPLIVEAERQIKDSGGNRSFWELLFKSQEAAFERYLQIASGETKVLLETQKSRFIVDTKKANIYPIHDNLLNVDSKLVISRSIFSVPKEGNYVLSGNIDFSGLYFPNSVQIDDKVKTPFTGKSTAQSISLPLFLSAGKHEFRIPIQQKHIELLNEEINLKSLDPASRRKTWNIELPTGTGQLILSFNYKLVRGNGPVVTIFREDNLKKPLLIEKYPTDTYDFDWKNKSVSIPIRSDLKKVIVQFEAVPNNDCEKNNPFDLKCKNEAFKEVYDRHSDFQMKQLHVTFKPDITISLKSMTTNADHDTSEASLKWQKLNPALYRLNVQKANKDQLVVFLNQFHTGWMLYPDYSLVDGEILNNWERYHTKEYASNMNYAEQFYLTLKSIIQTPVISQNNQVMVNGFANGWQSVPDGSYLLVFRPQQQLALGWVATTLYISLLSVNLVRSKKHSHEKTKKHK